MHRKLITVVLLAVVSICVTLVGTQAANATTFVKASVYKSCLVLHRDYEFGVAKTLTYSSAWAKKSYWFKPSVQKATYLANVKLDTNHNGVICETSPHYVMPKYLSPSTVEDYYYDTKVCHDRARNSAEQNWLFATIDSSYAPLLYPTAMSRRSYSGIFVWVGDTIANPRSFDPMELQKYQVQALNVFWNKAGKASRLCSR